MRFDKGEYFVAYTNSGAATASFNMSSASRDLLIQTIDVVSDLSGAVITIDASGTTLWQMQAGSANVPAHFNGLCLENGAANTLSANLTASSIGGYIAICGLQRL